MRIMLVDDDRIIQEGVAFALKRHHCEVSVFASGEDALHAAKEESYDGIILDLYLPDTDGFSVLQQWRMDGVLTPVLILTVQGAWQRRVEGINLGADDYLPKPFKISELIARLNAIVRRSKGRSSSRISAQGITLDLLSGTVTLNGAAVELGPLELRAISHLMLNKGSVTPSHELMDHVYGLNSDRSANALEALMKRLRKKLPAPIIRTRRGLGYIVQNGVLL